MHFEKSQLALKHSHQRNARLARNTLNIADGDCFSQPFARERLAELAKTLPKSFRLPLNPGIS